MVVAVEVLVVVVGLRKKEEADGGQSMEWRRLRERW